MNYEKGAELLTKCKTMQGYSVLIYKIREKQKAHGNLAAAIGKIVMYTGLSAEEIDEL